VCQIGQIPDDARRSLGPHQQGDNPQGAGDRELIAPACNGGTHMQQETECRARAAYCVRASEIAKNSAHRVNLLQQAQTFLLMADRSARMERLLQGEVPWASAQTASERAPADIAKDLGR
jgi:hypothetical protein